MTITAEQSTNVKAHNHNHQHTMSEWHTVRLHKDTMAKLHRLGRFKESYSEVVERDKEKELNVLKDHIEDAYAKGKISEQHYNLLNKKIESFVNTNKNKLLAANETHIMKRSPI